VYDPTLTQPRPPRRQWLRTTLIVVGVVAAVCVVASVARLATASALNQQPVANSQPGLGQAVRDGQFEFVVHTVTCGQSTLDNGILLHATAKGQFCVADLSARNIGMQARQFADGAQQAFGAQGQQYAADTGAGVVANGNGDAVWDVVNPGVSLDVKVVFDVPVGATIVRMVLHDSGLSRGVSVQVGQS
jgi:hypothetical protein